METTEEHSGYFCNVGEVLTIAILGSFCGLNNISQIHKWSTNQRVRLFLKTHFGVESIPCYYWLLCLLKLLKPKSLNMCFIKWVESILPNGVKDLTVSFDGKTVRSTGKMEKYEKALHIISTQIAELDLSVKDNLQTMKKNIEDYVQDDDLRKKWMRLHLLKNKVEE